MQRFNESRQKETGNSIYEHHYVTESNDNAKKKFWQQKKVGIRRCFSFEFSSHFLEPFCYLTSTPILF